MTWVFGMEEVGVGLALVRRAVRRHSGLAWRKEWGRFMTTSAWLSIEGNCTSAVRRLSRGDQAEVK